MDGRQSVFALGLTLLLSAASSAQPPADPNQPIKDILNEVMQRAADRKRDDQRRALQFLQRAEAARKAGRGIEAIELARKAQTLFPESPDIRKLVAGLAAEQRVATDQAASLAAARAALDEALEHIAALLKERRVVEAREIALAVQVATEMFPKGFDVAPQRGAAERFLTELQATNEPSVELIPVPPAALRDAPLTPSEMRLALARRIDVEWRDEPLSLVFPIIVQETGLKVTVDPALERLGVFDSQRAEIRVQNVPIERLLRMVTNFVGASYILREGEIYLTTKEKALALAAGRPEGRIDPQPPLRPNDPRAMPRSENGYVPGTLLPPPGVDKTPGYLLSGQALLDHISELLRTGPERPDPVDGK